MFSLVFAVIVCLSIVNADFIPSNVFYPTTLNETTCSNTYSWTMWFNTGSPNNVTGDSENASVILSQYPTYMCLAPIGVQAQTVNFQSGSYSYGWRYIATTAIVQMISYYTVTPIFDFRVRYCCPTGSFIGTTSTTTTSTTTTTMYVNNSICGKQAIPPKTSTLARIFGGILATPYSWPWMVYFQQAVACNTSATKICYIGCGSTLINKNYVMTAAHCVDPRNISNILLVAGIFNTSSQTESATRQYRSVQQVYVHPQWDPVNIINDIALIQVTTPFVFNASVQPACLPGAEPQPNDQVTIVGWGAETFAGNMTSCLKQAPTKIVGNCTAYWPQVNSAKQICVANSVTGDSVCQGDSGGPILSLDIGRYVASGVASFVLGCNTAGSSNKPNVYTRVAAYLPWMKSIIGQL